MANGNKLGTAWITIAPETAGISQKVASAINGGVEDATKNIAKGSAIGTTIGTVLGSAITSAISGVKNTLVGLVSDASAQMDKVLKTNNALAQMGYDLKAVNGYMEKLKKNANSTAATYGDLADGALKLVGAWGDLDVSMQGVQALSDAVLSFGGTADQINTVITQIGQMPMDGPLNAQTWLSLTNGGLTPVLGQMAELRNMTVGEFKDALGKGEITVRDFMNQLIELDKSGLEPLAKSNAAATFAGSIDNAKNTVITAISEELQSFWELSNAGGSIIDVADKIGVVVKKVFAKLKEWGDYIRTNLSPSIEKMTKALTPVLKKLGEFAKFLGDTAFKAAIQVFKALAEAIAFIAPTIETLLPFIIALVTELTALKIINTVKDSFLSLKSSISGAIEVFMGAAGSGKNLAESLLAVGSSGNGAISSMAGFAGSLGPVGIAITGVTAAAAALAVGIGATLRSIQSHTSAEEYSTQIINMKTDALNREKEASQQLAGVANELLNADKSVEDSHSSLIAKLQESGKSMEEAQKLYESYINGTLPNMSAAERDLVEQYSNYQTAEANRNAILEKKREIYNKTKEEVLKVAEAEQLEATQSDLQAGAYDKVTNSLQTYAQTLEHTSKDGLFKFQYSADEIKNSAQSLADKMGETDRDWKEAWQHITNNTKQYSDDIVIQLEAVPGRIKWREGMQKTAMDGIDGFKLGVDYKLPEVRASGQKAADAFNQGFRAGLDIHSPSRVMAENGNFTIQGLINGIESMHSKLNKTAVTIAEDVSSAFNDTVNFDNPILGISADTPSFENANARVNQYNNFNVASGFDIEQAASDLGYAVAMA